MSLTPRPASESKDRRGRPRKTSRDVVLEVALRIADAEGLAALTMRRLADELGLATMTLYNYVPTKEDILSQIGEAILGSLDISPGFHGSWEDNVFAVLLGVYEALREHPCGVELIGITQPIAGPGVDKIRDRLLAILYDAQFTPDRAVETIIFLFAYLIGMVTIETDLARRGAGLQKHIESLPSHDFPSLTADPAAWTHSLPADVVRRGLRALIATLAR